MPRATKPSDRSPNTAMRKHHHGYNPASSAQRGFTMVELMIAVAVLAVLTAIALPNFTSFMRRNNVTAHANDLLADLQYARSEALTQRSFVSLCPRAATAGEADQACADADSANFDGGWLIYGATSAHAAYDATDKQHPVLRLTSVPGTVSMRMGGAGILTFNARGELVGATGDTIIAVCYKPDAGQADAGISTTAAPGKQVRIAESGRVSVVSLNAGDTCS